MPTSELISTAKTPDDLDKAYASALKAVAKLGIKIAVKKLDGKVGTAMAKSKKPAEFRLLGDKGVIKIQVETKDFSSVLGLLDTAAERDAEKRLIIIESLVAAGLMTAAELKVAKAAAAPTADATVIKNYRKKLQDLTAQRAVIANLKLEQVLGSGAMLEKFRTFAKGDHTLENLDFIAAVSKKVAPEKILKDFIRDDAPFQVNLTAAEQRAAVGAGGKPDFAPAFANIVKLVKVNTLPRFVKVLTAAVDKQLVALKAEGEKAGIPEKQLS